MCNSFFAKNFRAFEEIKIAKLSKVNLFLGKNSVGKTALLEALYIYLHSSKTKAIYELLLKKEEHLSKEENLTSVIKHLFYKHSLPKPNQTGIELSSLKQGKVVKSKSVTITTDINDTFDESLIITQDRIKESYPLDKDFQYFYRRSEMFERVSAFKNLQFVYSMGLNNSSVAKLWDNIALDTKQDEVINALKIIEPELSDIAFIEYRRDRTAIARIAGEKVPFKSMGDGINRILHIVLSMVNAQDGYLLIDEFENGLHYSVQKQVWKVIFTLAQSLNVQVFATTHSSDCIKAFGFEWQKNEDIATLHRIDFYNKKHSTMAYKFSDLDDALNTNTEVR